MANCKEFQNLLPKEKIEYIGKLVHVVQSDSAFYEAGQKLIKKAAKIGIFDGVEIQPESWSPVPEEEEIIGSVLI